MARSTLSLSNLLLVLSLLSIVSAYIARPAPGGSPVTPEMRDITSKRQTNRDKILARQAIRSSSEIMGAVEQACKGSPGWNGGGAGGWPQKSGRTYPKCEIPCGYPGLARYKNWDLYGDDLPGNPQYPQPAKEEKCIEKCFKEDWKKSWEHGCVGVEWTPANNGACYLKGLKVTSGKFTHKSAGAKLPGTYLDLIGGCAAWSKHVPAAMDAVCCDSY